MKIDLLIDTVSYNPKHLSPKNTVCKIKNSTFGYEGDNRAYYHRCKNFHKLKFNNNLDFVKLNTSAEIAIDKKRKFRLTGKVQLYVGLRSRYHTPATKFSD